MSRARQVANFDPALLAADEVSGDKVSGGTIGAGVIGASVTGGAGLTGSTSLGTVTVANLSNTAIVYPVGHVIQIVGPATGSGYEQDTTDVYVATDVSQAITFTAGNEIYCIGSATLFAKDGGQDAGAYCQLNDGSSNFGQEVEIYFNTNASIDQQLLHGGISVISKISPSGTSVTISFKWKSSNSGNCRFNNNQSTLTLMEVQV